MKLPVGSVVLFTYKPFGKDTFSKRGLWQLGKKEKAEDHSWKVLAVDNSVENFVNFEIGEILNIFTGNHAYLLETEGTDQVEKIFSVLSLLDL